MCLLITKPANVEFKEEHLADFYQRNRDGIGVMLADNGFLHIYKQIPRNVQDVLDFYEKYAKGRDCAIHYRMRTHGDIDMDNCHPYPVFGFDEGDDHPMPMALMHNGVLHTGNDRDRRKSDTWHYIRDYLHKLLANDPSLAFSPEFADIIGKHIGANNKFVLMNNLGQRTTINESSGVQFEGAWLSNRYAWSADKYLPIKTYSTPSYGSGYYGRDGSYYVPGKGKEGTTAKKTGAGTGATKPVPTGTTKKNKPKQQPLIRNGGRTTWTNAEKNTSNGVSVDCKWLDDILELRDQLDHYNPVNGIKNKQLESLIEEVGVTKAYLLLELLGDEIITPREFESIISSRRNMREFGAISKEDWYRELPAYFRTPSTHH